MSSFYYHANFRGVPKPSSTAPKLNDTAMEVLKMVIVTLQVSLESALSQFPKGCQERWDRIAGKVPGKSKEQCMIRFRALAEVVKKRKAEINASS